MADLDTLFADFNKQYKAKIACKGISDVKYPRIPFTSPRANYMLYGGIPRNRMIEFFGDYSCGKTTTALDLIGNAQKLFELEEQGQKCVFVDAEHTLDYDWAKKLGVDVEELYVLDPEGQSAEQIFEMILEMVKTGKVGLIVLDSLANLVSQQECDKTMEERTVGGISASLTIFARKMADLLKQHKCTFIGINQIRCAGVGQAMSYALYDTPGGKSWKLNCSVRLEFKQGDLFDEHGKSIPKNSECPFGNEIKMHIKKTKVCKPNRRVGTYNLWYDKGIDKISDLFDIAQKEGIIQGKGWYTFVDVETGEVLMDENDKEIKINGKEAVIQFLSDNEIILQEIEQKLNKVIEGI